MPLASGMVLPITAVELPAAVAPKVTGEVQLANESAVPNRVSEHFRFAAVSADWTAKVGLVMLVGLLGLVTIAGMGSCAAPVTLKTRPWPAGRPSTLGSSATNTLPCGSTVIDSLTVDPQGNV